VLQETRVRAWLHPARTRTAPRVGCGRIATNVCGACARATTRAAAASKSSLGHEATIATDEDRRARRDATRSRRSRARSRRALPFGNSLALLRRAAPRAIAARLATPVETVRTRLKRGLAQLRAELDRKYGSRDAWSIVLATKLAWPGVLLR